MEPTTSSDPSTARPVLEPNKLGQFVALDGCPQFHQYEFQPDLASTRRAENNWKEAFEPLSLLLAKEGQDFEDRVRTQVEQFAHSVVEHDHIEDWEQSKPALLNAFENARNLPSVAGPIVIGQPRFMLDIEAWPVAGDADLIVVWPTDTGIRIRILDIKAAHEEKTYQQIQVACYTLQCRRFLENQNVGYDWEIEGGIIHRGTRIKRSTPDALPAFELSSRESDVRRLLQNGGRFDTLLAADPEDVRYQLAPKCQSCVYKEACFTDSIENESTALLGISQGEQATLARHGIETVHDIAELAYPPNDPRPYEYDDLTPVDAATYESLLNEPGIGERLPRYIQEAQALLSELDPENMYAPNTSSKAPWIQGGGDGGLPEDDPPFDDAELSIERGSLIRTYIHVEWDHRRDRVVMLSAYVTASRLGEDRGSSRTVSTLATEIPSTTADADEIEAEVVSEFFSKLFDAIRSVAAAINHEQEAAFHLYFYSNGEREALVDAVQRQDTAISDAARDLMGLRGSVHESEADQTMVSVIQRELETRIGLPTPNQGLLPVKDYFRPEEDYFSKQDWKYERPDGKKIDLSEAFHHKLFDYYVPYESTGGSISLYPDSDPDGYYPSRARQGSHIPLEYVWAALGEFTESWADELQEEYDSYSSIEPYQWVNRDKRDTRIQPADLKALGERLARCIAHVERGIGFRNSEIRKRELDLTEIEAFSLGPASIGRACREFLSLEYKAGRDELLSHLGQPVRQRIRRGEAIPLVVETARVTDDGRLDVEGHLLYDQLFDDGSRVASSCRQKGSSEATSGSWVIANKLDRQGEPIGSSKPHHLERGPGLTIQELDIESRYIRLTAISSYTQQDSEFTIRHRGWTVEKSKADDYTVSFQEDDIFVLDPRTDDLTSQRAYDMLREADRNPVCNLLETLADGNLTNPAIDLFPASAIQEFTDILAANAPFAPNGKQKAFIEDIDSKIALLQGPPGTGKTSGALALALLARGYASALAERPMSGVVTGESNKSVDEVLTGVAEAYQALADKLPQFRLVRLTGAEPREPHPAVEYVNYYEDREVVGEIIDRLGTDTSRQSTLSDHSNSFDSQEPLLVFTTPARLYGLVNRFDQKLDESIAPEDWMRSGARFFDLLAVDEASMMRLPSLALAGAFLTDDAQILIAGDQRQLPPVRQHDWETEDRRTTTELVPYLSTLDYFRALNGSDVDEIYHDECVLAGSADLRFYQLEQTYRCHQDLAEFLQEYVYAKDGISYRSDQRDVLDHVDGYTEGIKAMLDPKTPFVLIIHSERASQQSNPTEAAITSALTQSVSSKFSSGIVTPHNAQRGLLSTIVEEEVEVDTVERYQGGQRDSIFVSTTASDPDFLSAERDFILNPNRLNVALSRMKRKLVVVASESVFELVPPEVDKYERARLWKALYEHFGVVDRAPKWSGTVEDFLPEESSQEVALDTELRVFRCER